MHLAPAFAVALLFIGVISANPGEKAENYDNFCENMFDGNHADWRRGHCAPYFISCNEGHGWRQSCPNGLYYDGFVGQCLKKAQVLACCQKGKREYQLPMFTKKYFRCDYFPSGNYQDTHFPCASHYFTCDHGIGKLRYCADGLYFCEDKQRCVPANEIENCRARPTCD